MKRTKKQLEDDVFVLKRIVAETFYMAARYANGRRTYAPQNVRECYEELINRFPDDEKFRLQKDTVLPPLNIVGLIAGDDLSDLWMTKPREKAKNTERKGLTNGQTAEG